MSNNCVLIVANSVYQLLTAVHMKTSILNGRETDLLVTNVTQSLSDCLPRLKESGLFRRVIFGTTKDLSRKYGAAGGEKLTEVFADIPRIFRWVLNEELADYSQIYFSNFDIFTRMLACEYDHGDCAFFCYEDGFSSYVIDFLREDRAPVNRHEQASKIKEKIEGYLLYEPGLAMRGDSIKNNALPKMDPHDHRLKQLLNFIFDYHGTKEPADFIFLEQSFRAENIPCNDLDLMRECQQAVGTSRFLVKPHPRNENNIPLQLGLTRKYPNNVPWELFLLNEGAQGKTVITVCSNAALSGRILFGMDIPTVMLYHLFDGKVLWKENDILQKFLRKFHRQFAGKNYYVPNTIYELRAILNYLGGSHE
ncbi:MAG TPA: hypothetical protein H9662_06990 [Firmicutes bacterium]|nr:hypothetical protein [Bacillota bacterium]